MFVKICGITTLFDARMVAAAGANAIGLNFFPSSPRSVEISTAREILSGLPSFVDAVGVFVGETSSKIREVATPLGIRTVQIHGDLRPEQIVDLREFSVVTAFPLADEQSVFSLLRFLEACDRFGRLPTAVLVDAHVPNQFGGTGQVAPWSLARSVVLKSPVPVILAGGLTSRNVAAAVNQVRPWGIDVATGVEVAPGRKEPQKVRAFIQESRKPSLTQRPRSSL